LGSQLAQFPSALHSTADCSNQLLLLVGVKRAAKRPDDSHPLGYGREVYFWSFMVAMLLFSVGGAFSVYEGIHKIMHPDPVGEHVLAAIGVLVFSLLLEGGSTISNIKDLNKRRGSTPFFRYLRETKDSDLIVVFGENSAATLGLILALASLVLAWTTGDGRFDGVGSLLVGIVLIGVAIFLAVEVKSLLVGESADPIIEKAVREVAAGHDSVSEVLRVLTIQQGPGEVMVAMKVRMKDGISSRQVREVINVFEVDLQKRHPEIRWCFVEPDITDAEVGG
jgi:cation diffusion facilitator family transporter